MTTPDPEQIVALQSENARLRDNLKHSQGRFLSINICLSSVAAQSER